MSSFIQENSLIDIENSLKASDIANFAPELFNPYRLLIMSNLYRVEFLSFQQLKVATRIASDGNLASHLRYLESRKLIEVYKSFAGNHPKRFYFLTVQGRDTFEKLAISLEKYVSWLRIENK